MAPRPLGRAGIRLLDPQLYNHLERIDCLNFFFCYRWILIIFKRELEYGSVMRLWEALWSRHLCAHFHLFVCVAVLQRHRLTIMNQIQEFDDLLRFVNDLSGKIDLDAALHDAEVLYRYAGQAGQDVLPLVGP